MDTSSVHQTTGQRVGPRDDWRYERRFIPPVVVNPGQSNDSVTIYRLPEPPTGAKEE